VASDSSAASGWCWCLNQDPNHSAKANDATEASGGDVGACDGKGESNAAVGESRPQTRNPSYIERVIRNMVVRYEWAMVVAAGWCSDDHGRCKGERKKQKGVPAAATIVEAEGLESGSSQA